MIWKFPTYNPGIPIDWTTIESEYDWFQDMQEIPQDPEWHAEGNVQIHTKMVAEALVNLAEYQALEEQEKQVLFAAALLHDIEKRSTTTTKMIDGRERIVSPNHAKRGEYVSRNMLYREWGVPFKVREEICKLVRHHSLPIWAIEKPDPIKAVITASTVLNTKLVAMLAKADVLGRICQDAEEILLKIDLFEELCRQNNCWGTPYPFASNYGRFLYLNRDEMAPIYEPFNDLKFEVVMLSALPGSGKDTYIQQNLDLPMVSLDAIRRANKISPTDKRGNGKVIQLGKEQAKVYMRAKQSFVFNATNLTTDVRSKWISLFSEYGGRVRIVYLEVPYKKLLQQNRNREHVVPLLAVERMIRRLEVPVVREAHSVEWLV